MRYYHQLSILSVLAAAPLADLLMPLAPLWNDTTVKHTWNTVPANWESLGDPPAYTTIDLHVALKPYHENALIDALYEVSNPRHRKYGAHLSKEQVAELVAPHPHALELVTSWLEYNGILSPSISTTHGGAWLTVVDVPVSQANELLGASYQLYRHAGINETTILRTVSYALPAVLHKHVQTVVPTTCFASTSTLWQTPRGRSVGAAAALENAASRKLTVLPRGNQMIMPARLRWLYKTSAYVPSATHKNVLGVAGYLGQYPSLADMKAFMGDYRRDAMAATFTVVQVNGGGNDLRHPGSEANVDIQYAQAMAYPTPHIFYSTGGGINWSPSSKEPAPGDLHLEWLNYMISQTNIPQTISTSYGLPEKNLPLEYTTAVCKLFAQLGARGVSVLFSSGDDGVGRGECKNDTGEVNFIPSFPASCPWVTSVGGTTSQFPEVAASLSGGGFSFHFPRPSYQKDAVPTFLNKLDGKHDGLYNADGRGIPDISAQALKYLFTFYNDVVSVSGTSCAVPTVAGVISLLNDYLISNGKDPLGFLNPWLYSDGFAGLNDITSGSNPGCGTDGFSTTVGWDPVTGLGTPDFIKLQRAVDNRAVGGATSTITSFTDAPDITGSAEQTKSSKSMVNPHHTTD